MNFEDEKRVLQNILDGYHGSARFTIEHMMTREQLQKLSDALDYYAVLVDDELIRGLGKRS